LGGAGFAPLFFFGVTRRLVGGGLGGGGELEGAAGGGVEVEAGVDAEGGFAVVEEAAAGGFGFGEDAVGL
jgi:hypothetical protein